MRLETGPIEYIPFGCSKPSRLPCPPATSSTPISPAASASTPRFRASADVHRLPLCRSASRIAGGGVARRDIAAQSCDAGSLVKELRDLLEIDRRNLRRQISPRQLHPAHPKTQQMLLPERLAVVRANSWRFGVDCIRKSSPLPRHTPAGTAAETARILWRT